MPAMLPWEVQSQDTPDQPVQDNALSSWLRGASDTLGKIGTSGSAFDPFSMASGVLHSVANIAAGQYSPGDVVNTATAAGMTGGALAKPVSGAAAPMFVRVTDPDRIAATRALAAQGADHSTIWQKLQTFIEPGSNAVVEEVVPTAGVKQGVLQHGQPTPLSEYLNDPAYFARLPELNKVNVLYNENAPAGSGYWSAEKNEIGLSPGHEVTRAVIEHEINHVAQTVGGLQRGGSPTGWAMRGNLAQSGATSPEFDILHEILTTNTPTGLNLAKAAEIYPQFMSDNLRERAAAITKYPEYVTFFKHAPQAYLDGLGVYADAVGKTKPAAQMSNFDKYSNMWGEAASRVAEARLNPAMRDRADPVSMIHAMGTKDPSDLIVLQKPQDFFSPIQDIHGQPHKLVGSALPEAQAQSISQWLAGLSQ